MNVLNRLLSSLQIGKEPIFITGHGRSGTTWLGYCIGNASNVLFYNEPCAPYQNEGNWSEWFKYVRPDGHDRFYEQRLDPAFKGLISDGRTWLRDRAYRRVLPGYRVVIKEVAAVTSVEWVYQRYQPAVLIMLRHPCGVALSEKNKKTPTDNPIQEIIKQTTLLDDHLGPYLSTLEKAKRPYEIYGAVWGARNRVIADNMKKYPVWEVVHYEDICKDPIGKIHDLFCHFELTWSKKVEKEIRATTTEDRPGTHSIHRVTLGQIDKWKRKMSPDEIEQVRSFVTPFNLPFYNSDADWSIT